MTVLVTGGAGYIGSVVVDQLIDRGDGVVVLDNLSRGPRHAINDQAVFVEGSIGNEALVTSIVEEHRPDTVVHFAGYIAVGESTRDPGLYFDVNVAQSISLLNALHAAGVGQLVFSSSAAVYGNPAVVPIPEKHGTDPTSPYGWTKLAFEQMLEQFSAAHGFRSAALRYFNAAGATERRREEHNPETHLIPLILAAAAGTRDHIDIFGSDYPTPDGTAIRDYIHVSDLAAAHLAAVDYLRTGGETTALNLGTGTGYSVLEVIAETEAVIGRPVPWRFADRRPGDPAELVAAVQHASHVLGWEPLTSDLPTIIQSAWDHATPAH